MCIMTVKMNDEWNFQISGMLADRGTMNSELRQNDIHIVNSAKTGKCIVSAVVLFFPERHIAMIQPLRHQLPKFFSQRPSTVEITNHAAIVRQARIIPL